MKRATALLSASLLVVSTALADPNRLRAIADAVEIAKKSTDVASALRDPELAELEWVPPLREQFYVAKDPEGAKLKDTRLRIVTSLRKFAEIQAIDSDPGATARAESVLHDPRYRSAPEDAKATWLSRGLRGFVEWLKKLFERPPSNGPEFNPPDLGGLGGFAAAMVRLFIGLIVVAIVGGLGWMIYKTMPRVAGKRKSKSKGGILGDEPERTRDEYLSLADELAAQGQFRQAIRMTYLAMLKRFAEARVARFERSETNWEHYNRIIASPRFPTGFDFRTPTKEFDLFWYGNRPCGRGEYEAFAAAYRTIDLKLKGATTNA